jgi:GT2 family glycosyltransferase
LSNRVCAAIVTYNRRELLRECLLALEAQTRRVDEICIIINASTDGTREMLKTEFPQYPTVEMPENTGASGGFSEGIKWSYEHGFDWAWTIDDEARPAPDCLEKLLEHARPNRALVPLQQDRSGRFHGVAIWRRRNIDVAAEVVAQKQPLSGDFLFDFTATLISKEIVARAGLPNKDFFIWFDDHEYALRARSKAGAEIIVVPEAIVYCDFGQNRREVRFLGKRSLRSDQPAWKTYYGARNPLYTLLRTRRKPDELFLYSLVNLRLMLMDIVYEPDRWERVKMRLLGMRDGIVGRLGKQVAPPQ